MENRELEATQVKGWGEDADPKNDPTYPIKKRTDAEQDGYVWKRPTQQESDVEILRSIERGNIPAVYGTALPPRGLSGAIRRLAFRYSETTYRHWLALLLADRVNMVEGLLDDVSRGRIPNVFEERGHRAQWRYDRKRLVTKYAIGAAAVGALAIWLNRKRKR